MPRLAPEGAARKWYVAHSGPPASASIKALTCPGVGEWMAGFPAGGIAFRRPPRRSRRHVRQLQSGGVECPEQRQALGGAGAGVIEAAQAVPQLAGEGESRVLVDEAVDLDAAAERLVEAGGIERGGAPRRGSSTNAGGKVVSSGGTRPLGRWV